LRRRSTSSAHGERWGKGGRISLFDCLRCTRSWFPPSAKFLSTPRAESGGQPRRFWRLSGSHAFGRSRPANEHSRDSRPRPSPGAAKIGPRSRFTGGLRTKIGGEAMDRRQAAGQGGAVRRRSAAEGSAVGGIRGWMASRCALGEIDRMGGARLRASAASC